LNPQQINLNADLGESFGAWQMGDDAAMLSIVGSANVACGLHAGDPLVMRRTARLAAQHGVSIGAHPSYPDLQGFGRRVMQMSADELEACILYQIGALQAMAHAEGTRVSHVKPHGALNNVACKDPVVADTVVRAMQRLNEPLPLLAPALSELTRAAARAGVPVRHEVFADRTYLADAQLTPRSMPGAVLHEPQACVAHVLTMLERGGIVTHTGQVLPTPIDSICVHGDGAQAVLTARTLRQALESRGYRLLPLDRMAATA
jgi:UPF0271 protein